MMVFLSAAKLDNTVVVWKIVDFYVVNAIGSCLIAVKLMNKNCWVCVVKC